MILGWFVQFGVIMGAVCVIMDDKEYLVRSIDLRPLSHYIRITVTSSLDPEELLLHFHEVGEGEGQDHHDEA